jgi:acetyl-CoA carboxylase carboxyl transferase subunit beta
VICVDIPPEEDPELGPALRAAGVSLIRLATPTTDAARLPAVLDGSSGFLYYVSVAGITGMQQAAQTSIDRGRGAAQGFDRHSGRGRLRRAHARTGRAIAKVADGVVVGSALVDLVAQHGANAAGPVRELTHRRAGRCRPFSTQGNRMSWLNKVRNALPFTPKRDTHRTTFGSSVLRAAKCCSSRITRKTSRFVRAASIMAGSVPMRGLTSCWTQALTLLPAPKVKEDPLKFRDSKKYVDRIKAARAANPHHDALTNAFGRIEGHKAVVGVQDFAFMGGSMGMAVGNAFVAGCDRAVREKCPYHLHRSRRRAHAGGHSQPDADAQAQPWRLPACAAGLPYIVVLTDPTTGGVTASYAMLGDVQIAEPGA